MDESQIRTESQTTDPLRFVWLRRGAIGFILLLLTLVALRLWWGHEANRRIAELARAAYARGEPFYPEDFRQPPIPDATNAAVPIQSAINQISKRRGSYLLLKNGDRSPPLQSEIPSLQSFVSNHRSEIRLVREARSLPEVSWDGTPLFSNSIPALAGFRSLAHALIFSAMLKRAQGEDAEAIEYAQDALALVHVLDQRYPQIAVHMIAGGISNLDTDFIRTSAMSLIISDNIDSGATPTQVCTLIDALQNEQPVTDVAVRDFYGERAMVIDGVPQIATTAGWPMQWVLEPMYETDGVRIAQIRAIEGEACRQPSWPAARAKLKPIPTQSLSALEGLAHPATVISAPYDRAVYVHFQMLANRRIAAIMLALRLYEVDHEGKLPESLSQLVPGYLPAIPTDPFDPAGGPIRYLPHRTPPAIYSVGLNGKDDHGSEKIVTRDFQSDQEWQGEDAVFLLVPQPRI